MLGKREPDIYGATTLQEINNALAEKAEDLSVDISFFQSNSEGEIVSTIQDAMTISDGIIINPGAYTHTSVAIRDAILSCGLPVVEVHISNVHKREDFRQKSFVNDDIIEDYLRKFCEMVCNFNNFFLNRSER